MNSDSNFMNVISSVIFWEFPISFLQPFLDCCYFCLCTAWFLLRSSWSPQALVSSLRFVCCAHSLQTRRWCCLGLPVTHRPTSLLTTASLMWGQIIQGFVAVEGALPTSMLPCAQSEACCPQLRTTAMRHLRDGTWHHGDSASFPHHKQKSRGPLALPWWGSMTQLYASQRWLGSPHLECGLMTARFLPLIS